MALFRSLSYKTPLNSLINILVWEPFEANPPVYSSGFLFKYRTVQFQITSQEEITTALHQTLLWRKVGCKEVVLPGRDDCENNASPEMCGKEYAEITGMLQQLAVIIFVMFHGLNKMAGLSS